MGREPQIGLGVLVCTTNQRFGIFVAKDGHCGDEVLGRAFEQASAAAQEQRVPHEQGRPPGQPGNRGGPALVSMADDLFEVAVAGIGDVSRGVTVDIEHTQRETSDLDRRADLGLAAQARDPLGVVSGPHHGTSGPGNQLVIATDVVGVVMGVHHRLELDPRKVAQTLQDRARLGAVDDEGALALHHQIGVVVPPDGNLNQFRHLGHQDTSGVESDSAAQDWLPCKDGAERLSAEDQPTVVGESSPVTSSLTDLTGQLLDDRYRIVRKTGAGSMGDVYEAIDRQRDQRVAVKVLKPERAHRGVFLDRFVREARSASMVRHPNVVEIHEVGQVADGPIYFVMEFLEGEDLSAVLRREYRLPWSRCRNILHQMASALQAAHERGIVHRDIKPSNCLLLAGTDRGVDRVKLVDFGVAKLGVDMVSKELTSAADVVGTVLYMSPEQAQGMPADARSDVYALGVMAYEMATGRVPFPGKDIFKVMARHLRTPPTPPRQAAPDLPIEAERVILRALAKRPEERFSSMAELLACLDGAPISTHPSTTRRQGGHEEADPHAPTMISPVHVVDLEDDDDEGPDQSIGSETFDEQPTAYFRLPRASPAVTQIASPIHPSQPTAPLAAPAGAPPREHTRVAEAPPPFLPVPAPPSANVPQHASATARAPAWTGPRAPQWSTTAAVDSPWARDQTERADPLPADSLEGPVVHAASSRSGLWAALILSMFVAIGLVIAFASR